MKAGIAQSGRTIVAALTAALMVLSVMFVFADSADATHDTNPTIEGFTPQSNSETYWEGLGYGECEKTDQGGDGPYVLGDPPAGTEWTLLLFKQAQENIYWENPIPGHAYYDAQWSHLIRCWDQIPPPPPPPPPPPEPGEIIVVQEVTEGSDTSQSFDFTSD